MTAYLSSGSALERSMICGASVALPHNRFTSEHTTRGTEIHSFLEACSTIGRDAALELVPEEWREVCAELNLDGLHVHLTLAAEVAFAYNVATDTARELGRGVGRIYDDVGEDEIPCTLDVVGVRDLESGLRRGLYTDWKSGFRNRKSIDSATQIDFGSLCVARAYSCDLVEGQLVNVHEDFAPHVQRKTIEAWELDAFAAELREKHEQWRELRAQMRAGFMPKEFEIGPWCEQCPAREYCPGQTSLLRSVLSRDLFDGLLRMEPIPDAALADAWDQIHAAQSVLSLVKGKILGVAAVRKIFLGKTPDGERWLGPVISEGNDKLDGEHVFDTIAAMPVETWRDGVSSDDVATAATRVTATKKDIDAAIKDATPRGRKAAILRDLYAKLEAIPGAITNKLTTAPKEFVVKSAAELAPGIVPTSLPGPGESGD